MTDETEGSAAPEIELVMGGDSRSEVYEWDAPSGKGGLYIFPAGVEAWAETNGVDLVHIDKTTGVVTVQHELGTPFRQIDKPLNTGAVKQIK
jgi:hypothetical protein